MTGETILYIVIAGVISFALAIFMYAYKSKYAGKLRWVFGVLRFLTLFALMLLLINPKFTSDTYTIQKPKLAVLVDNSASVVELGYEEQARNLLSDIKGNSELNNEFELSYFTFGSEFNSNDSLSFSEKNTQIANALNATNELFRNDVAPVLLISDGNQTLGLDYEFLGNSFSNPIYPIILGDSVKYLDLKIQQLNTNRYAFLKNQFPVETILVYSGTESVSTQFIIQQNGTTVYRKNVAFSEENNTETLSFTLPANSVGLQKYTAQIVPLDEEKNKTNNYEQFAVEVIDQATNVLIVSDIIHPDLGALRKSITTNEQRTVTFKKPSEAVSILNDYQLVILFQPDRSFASVYAELNKLKKNTFTFAGFETDWDFLNTVQQNFNKEVSNQREDVSGVLNFNYGTFAAEDIGFEGFPPLLTQFGELAVLIPHETMLEQNVDGFSTGSPMLATMEIDGRRHAIWDGEGIWKWRSQTYQDRESFEEFDAFVAKLVQYLASNKRRSRLEVSNETFYYNNNPIRISAQYFDKNFSFDSRASVMIALVAQETNETYNFPMLLRNNFYEVDLDNLPAGDYKYTVSVRDESVARSGSFTILDFNVEQQFLNADVTKLNRLSTSTGGMAYFIDNAEAFYASLINDDRFQPIQKKEQKVVPLIDWKYLLGFLVLTLAMEWFIRKYNGLI